MPKELENIVESIIFASPEGASTKEITRCVRGAVASAREKDGELAPDWITRFADTDEARVAAAISHLNAIYEETGRAFMLVERPAGWRIMSRVDFSPWVRQLFPDKKPSRLTPSALETLAIIAYRQPMTKSSIEAVRGVSVDGPLQALLDRNVVRIAGRADLPGRPLLYETTDLFLEHFGIKTVEELPNASELRSVKLPEPEQVILIRPAPQSGLPLEVHEDVVPENQPQEGIGSPTKRKFKIRKTGLDEEVEKSPESSGTEAEARNPSSPEALVSEYEAPEEPEEMPESGDELEDGGEYPN